VVLPHPPIIRGLRELVQEIRTRLPNVFVCDFPAYKHDEGWAITSSLYFTDGGAADEQVIAESGEPWKPLTKWIIKENPCVKELNRSELEYWNEEREEFRSEYLRHWNSSTGKWCSDTGSWIDVVDVILCPVAPWIAAKHGTSKYWSYTSIWNLLDYPALAFPIPTGLCALKDIDVKVQRKSFLSDIDKDLWQHCEYSSSSPAISDKTDDPDAVDGMAISLQLVGRRFEDETVVAVAQYLQKTLGS
jgi:amidase